MLSWIMLKIMLKIMLSSIFLNVKIIQLDMSKWTNNKNVFLKCKF